MPNHREPERTCVGCRSKDAKGALARVVRRLDGQIASDPSGRAAGRGAYVHPREECLSRAERNGSFERALGARLTPAGVASLMGELRASVGEAD